VRSEGLGKLKNFTSSGTRTGDLPACSIVPQPNTLPHAPLNNQYLRKFCKNIDVAAHPGEEVGTGSDVRSEYILKARQKLEGKWKDQD
jgi:hypothetical protein